MALIVVLVLWMHTHQVVYIKYLFFLYVHYISIKQLNYFDIEISIYLIFYVYFSFGEFKSTI